MVSRLFVRPAARGQRLGEQMLSTATAFAAQHHLDLVLDVVDDGRTAAIQLYERLGWRMVGHRSAGWITPAGIRPQLCLYVLPADHA
ncbi:MAG: GNAT family N-acetyltransferase [Nocardioidaceae bacterium]